MTETPNAAAGDAFLDGLAPVWRRRFDALPQADKIVVLGSAPAVMDRALRISDAHHRGINLRNKWVSGVEHMRALIAEPSHFMDLVLRCDREAVECLVDLATDVRDGRHATEADTDPALFRLLQDGCAVMEQRHYLTMDTDALIDFLEAHPDRNPRLRAPARAIATAVASARLARNISQQDLARACGVSSRTILNLEKGLPVSSETAALAMDRLGLLRLLSPATPQPRRRARRSLA